MGKIFYLMGKSSSGKDTIYRKILKSGKVRLFKIVPYTTRPIREGERDGVQYNFIDKDEFIKLKESGKVIEYRVYDTFYGEWIYCTVDDKNIDIVNKSYLVIGTPESYFATKKYFGDEVVLPILIDVDDGVRLQRALKRERNQEVPKYEEMCRRFLADAKDFSEEKLKEYGISDKFSNEKLDDCLKNILEYIEANI